MKSVKPLIFTFITLLSIYLSPPALARQQNDDADSVCNNVPRDLGNRVQAIQTLQDTEFTFEQSLETLQVFGVKKATYYSCDGNLGYLVVNTYRRNYLYENVPRELWENFKNAYSIDGFFTKNLKFNTIYLY
ncbi:hypothetical protein AB9P05_20125 [Roseivirga sp. BDSF3-8]|uniref:hypothetical protein n=1 Tax=Roseivirga sp. BDSF3-8 TaxID=3241598 RepID=UPI0035318ADD